MMARRERLRAQAAAGRRTAFGPLLATADWEAFVKSHLLTPRQAQVLDLICRGHGYVDLCAHLGMKRSTLRTHLRTAYEKVGCTDRVGLILSLVHRYGVSPREYRVP
ncbi:MAG: helix-turn-helix transcriptional regulator [Phycisphaerae bacterium]|nr:helix-turn-helix transcriptional regulator [Phycisphaerae bacterium]